MNRLRNIERRTEIGLMKLVGSTIKIIKSIRQNTERDIEKLIKIRLEKGIESTKKRIEIGLEKGKGNINVKEELLTLFIS